MKTKRIIIALLFICVPIFVFSQGYSSTNQKNVRSKQQNMKESIIQFIQTEKPVRKNGDGIQLDYKAIDDFVKTFKANTSPGENESNLSVATTGYVSVIKGTVYESDGTTPIVGAAVRIYNALDQQIGWDDTDSNGNYAVGNIGEGSYYAYADGYATEKGDHYYPQYYNGSTTKAGASWLTVTGEDTVENINFSLNSKGSMSGRILEDNGEPIANTMVSVYCAALEFYGGAFTNANGYYTIYALPSGSYEVMASGYIIGEGEFFVEEYCTGRGGC